MLQFVYFPQKNYTRSQLANMTLKEIYNLVGKDGNVKVYDMNHCGEFERSEKFLEGYWVYCHYALNKKKAQRWADAYRHDETLDILIMDNGNVAVSIKAFNSYKTSWNTK